jgi:hypothetical protein
MKTLWPFIVFSSEKFSQKPAIFKIVFLGTSCICRDRQLNRCIFLWCFSRKCFCGWFNNIQYMYIFINTDLKRFAKVAFNLNIIILWQKNNRTKYQWRVTVQPWSIIKLERHILPVNEIQKCMFLTLMKKASIGFARGVETFLGIAEVFVCLLRVWFWP